MTTIPDSGIDEYTRKAAADLDHAVRGVYTLLVRCTTSEIEKAFIQDEIKRLLKDYIAPALKIRDPHAVSTSINIYE
jgi:hypothetical protein